jgi:hypothetical protein
MLEPLSALIRYSRSGILAQTGQPVFPVGGPDGGTASNTVCRSVAGNAVSCATTYGQHSGVPPFLWIFVAFWMAGILLALYAANDMSRRGQSGRLWGALVIFGGWIGIIFWLSQRRQYPIRPGL